MRFLKITTFIFAAGLLLLGCAKEYSAESYGKKIPTGTWEFKDSSREYMGKIDTAYIIVAGNKKQLNLIGKSLDGSENWKMQLTADTFKVGTYQASLFQAAMKYDGAGKSIYLVNQLSGVFAVKISVINGTLLTGTFSGNARDSLNISKKVYEGKFTTNLSGNLVEPPSIGVLGSAAGNCDQVVLNGEYKEGIALLTGNTAEIKVVVATPGTYYIYTNDVNGIKFSANGIFTTTGAQTVLLKGIGTPAFPGNQSYTLHYGTSLCGFKIDFLNGASASRDYYPLTANTNWKYGLANSEKMQNKVLPGINTINGVEYTVITTDKGPNAPLSDTLINVRKSSGNYYGFFDYRKLSGINFDIPVYGEHIFLKDNVAIGNSWSTPVIEGKVSGITIPIIFKYTILSKGIAEKVGGFDFDDLIKVKEEVFLSGVLYRTSEYWYAKNVGPVYIKNDTQILVISDYQVL